MTDRTSPNLAKWPFVVGDLLLLLTAYWIVNRSPNPFAVWPLFFVVALVAAGAWLAVTPFLVEYRAALRCAETNDLTSTVSQINNVREVAGQIGAATSQWVSIQEQSAKTVTAAAEIADRIAAEANAFTDFMGKANDAERNRLRLEIDKLRRNESEWLQVLVRLMDHVYALYQAGARSGQANVHAQLSTFQNACRDVVRRLGLVPVDAEKDEPFDEARHQVLDGQPAPVDPALVSDMIATGFSFQGQLIRRVVVAVKPASASAPLAAPAIAEATAEEEIPTQDELLSLEDESPQEDIKG